MKRITSDPKLQWEFEITREGPRRYVATWIGPWSGPGPRPTVTEPSYRKAYHALCAALGRTS